MIDRYTNLSERSHLFSVLGVAGGPRLYKASWGHACLRACIRDGVGQGEILRACFIDNFVLMARWLINIGL